jgi:hypothetical protein
MIKLDHVGWVTNNVELFEAFWVKGLGFKRIGDSRVSKSKANKLFGIDFGAKCFRYKLDDIIIEIHVFDFHVHIGDGDEFVKHGINHISLTVDNREEFLKELLLKIDPFPVNRATDPRGWDNIFIQDYEGNWIELREKF